MTEKNNGFKDRLTQIVGGKSVSSWAKRCNVNEASFRQYLKEAMPRLNNLIAIADAANVNVAWLATGEGPMRKGDAAPIPQPLALPQSPPADNVAQSAPYAAFDALEVVEGMGMLTRIYSSGDTTYIRAINANLMAFSDAITMKKNNQDMQSQLNIMENRIAGLEEKLSKMLEVRQKVANGD
jgi:hypothetical protein